ncbi:MAG TPA: serine hydrolase, partial [Vicinamibacterales bacterium]|nr:serine hydrolase [Vicinamibacterales bacterium]
DTRAGATTDAVPGQAVFYFPRFAADPRYGPQSPERVDYSCFSGSSAFLSTPSDLVRFVVALGAGRLLKPATVELLQTSQRLASGQDTGYGLGWEIEHIELKGTATRTIGYDGELKGGVVVSCRSVPSAGVTVAVFSNISYASTPVMAERVARIFADPD